MNQFDYIIVGAGSAGCVVANRLSQNSDTSVLLVEAGGKDKHPLIKIPAAMSRMMQNPDYTWKNPTLPNHSTNKRVTALLQGKTLGGSSSINGMIYLRGQRQDYDGWAANGCAGWSWDEVLPYFKKSEHLESGGTAGAHGKNGELKISWIDKLHTSSQAFMQAAMAYGMPFNSDMNDGDPYGIGYLQGTIFDGHRQSAATAFLKPALKRRNLAVRTYCPTHKVLFKNGCATGIEIKNNNGQVERFYCRKDIILCAGAIGSPQILQRSGIGDANYLASIGISSVAHSPQVGRNLQDHLFAHIKLAVNDPAHSQNAILRSRLSMALEAIKWLSTNSGTLNTTSSQVIGFLKSSEQLERADLQIAMRPFSFHIDSTMRVAIDTIPAVTVSVIQSRPYSRGEVQITSADPEVLPAISSNYLADERDARVLARGLEQLRGIIKQPHLASIVKSELEPGRRCIGEQDLVAYLRSSVSTVYHPVGTCRMGDDAAAVVDTDLRVNGVNNLRVADASIMPTIVSSNTNAAATMIGEKAADLIVNTPSGY